MLPFWTLQQPADFHSLLSYGMDYVSVKWIIDGPYTTDHAVLVIAVPRIMTGSNSNMQLILVNSIVTVTSS